MEMTCSARWVRLGVLVLGLAPTYAGCNFWPLDTNLNPGGANAGQTSGSQSDGSSQAEQVLAGNTSPPPAADSVTEIEPNDDFSTAQPVSFNETVRISGSIAAGSEPRDQDIFDLGPAYANDRVLADLQVDSGADVVLGLLDESYRILDYIDPTSSSSGPRQADFVVRENTGRLYLVLGTRSISDKDRPYVARISVQRGLGEITQHPQVLVLNFQGAQGVRIGSRAPVDVPPFDAGTISPRFAGQTQTVIDLIAAKVQTDFAGLGIQVYVAGDPATPPGDHSTIYYGSYDSRLLGLADNVDPYNTQTVQSAILYTDTFAIFNALSPSVEQISQVLANTTSHEAGHLLGLRHTADPVDLMDTTATARQMMLNQDFNLAKLNASVLPTGMQDEPVLLSWTLGGELIPAAGKPTARLRAIQAASQPDDFYIPRDWLMDCSGSK